MNHRLRTISFRRRGFSLVEVVIAMAITLLVTVSIFSIFITSSKMAVESFMRNKTAMDARLVIDKLTTDARMAATVENAYGKYTADNKTLILKLPAIDADGFAIDPETKFDYVIYHQEGTSPIYFVRTVVANADSSRESTDEIIGDSASPGVYAVQPDALGSFVLYYRFDSVQERGDKDVRMPSAGTIQLRNHS